MFQNNLMINVGNDEESEMSIRLIYWIF